MRRLLLALLVLTLTPTLRAADKWSDFYNRGVAASQAGDWKTVSDQMQKSIALKPVEEQSARVRNDLIVYVPHFWLGIAKVNLNDPDAALSEFQLSQTQGVVQNTTYYSELRKWVSQAQQARQRKLSDLSSDSRKTAEAALGKALNGQVEAMAAGADRSDTYRAALRQLQGAMDQYGKAGTDSNAYRQSAQAFAQVSEAFASAAREAKARKARPPAVAAQPPAQPSVTPPPAPQPVRVSPPPAVAIPPAAATPTAGRPSQAALAGVLETARSLRDQINEARGAYRSDRAFQSYATTALRQVSSIENRIGQVSDAPALQKLAQELSSQSRSLDERTAALRAVANRQQKAGNEKLPLDPERKGDSVRSQLQSAFSAFARGNVDLCESIASSLIESRAAGADAFLLRGVARYTRAMVSNQRAVLSAAAADFSSALALNSAVGLDPRFFSPKLVSFFSDVRKKSLAAR